MGIFSSHLVAFRHFECVLRHFWGPLNLLLIFSEQTQIPTNLTIIIQVSFQNVTNDMKCILYIKPHRRRLSKRRDWLESRTICWFIRVSVLCLEAEFMFRCRVSDGIHCGVRYDVIHSCCFNRIVQFWIQDCCL